MTNTNDQPKYQKPRCKRCNSKNLVPRVDGSSWCRNCGYDTRIVTIEGGVQDGH